MLKIAKQPVRGYTIEFYEKIKGKPFLATATLSLDEMRKEQHWLSTWEQEADEPLVFESKSDLLPLAIHHVGPMEFDESEPAEGQCWGFRVRPFQGTAYSRFVSSNETSEVIDILGMRNLVPISASEEAAPADR